MAFGERLPEIPDFAVDMHTGRGEAMGRDYRYFMEEASKVSPESATKETKYRDWILAALDAGKLTLAGPCLRKGRLDIEFSARQPRG